ncbi:hypothetical protein CK203_075861 [Vitis vinifera]|uniref:Uncharacterized protein n=1 Tax=Vitis vinifera TaxID=29760 RepID=A0A438EF50_VITVI|nr:hypothetical protein CK203_075861 [Vitis vinifera]
MLWKGQPQISGRESTAASEENTIEDVIQNHDLFISTLRSRLTKLQVILAGNLNWY